MKIAEKSNNVNKNVFMIRKKTKQNRNKLITTKVAGSASCILARNLFYLTTIFSLELIKITGISR